MCLRNNNYSRNLGLSLNLNSLFILPCNHNNNRKINRNKRYKSLKNNNCKNLSLLVKNNHKKMVRNHLLKDLVTIYYRNSRERNNSNNRIKNLLNNKRANWWIK